MDGDKIPVVEPVGPFRAAYGPRARVGLDVSAETTGTNVKQSFRDEVDVNQIIVRFRTTGVLPQGTVQPLYLDVAEFPSYQEALERVRAGTEYFMSLPAEQREDFRNDPALFMDWVTNPANAEEAAKRYGVNPVVADPAAGTVDPEPVDGGSPASS